MPEEAWLKIPPDEEELGYERVDFFLDSLLYDDD
jgi:hypothetical protein